MSWSHQIDLILDVRKRMEPLLLEDGRPTKLPTLIQGSKVHLNIRLAEVNDGILTYIAPEATDAMSVCGMKRSLRGDALYSIPALSPMELDYEQTGFTGLLNLHTLDLDEALSDYAQIDTTLEIILTNEAGEEVYKWQMLAPVAHKTCATEPPIVPGGNTYYTDAECDTLFARKDGPNGYAMKLVEYGGKLYWAQAVEGKWVFPMIMKIGGFYTATYIEAGDVE